MVICNRQAEIRSRIWSNGACADLPVNFGEPPRGLLPSMRETMPLIRQASPFLLVGPSVFLAGRATKWLPEKAGNPWAAGAAENVERGRATSWLPG